MVETGPIRINIVVLAAGRSSRMGEGNKLLKAFGPEAQPMVRHVVRTALDARGRGDVFVVVGHQEGAIRDALSDFDVRFVANPDFAEGLSTSLRAGFAGARNAEGVMVVLCDQPLLTSGHLSQLMATFKVHAGSRIVAAADRGLRRNPVVIPSRLGAALERLTGDRGAGAVIDGDPHGPVLVEIGRAASVDTDTPETFAEAERLLANDV